MHPNVVIDWGPLHLAVSAYRVAVVGAAVIAVLGTIVVAIRRGLPRRQVTVIVAAAAVGAVAGARLLGAVNTDTAILDRSFGAFSIWGALLGGLLVGSVGWRLRGSPLPVGAMLDATAVPAGVAIGVARTGCLCAGCCFGLPTHVPWGVTYPSGSNAHIANLDSTRLLDSLFSEPPPVHPIPIYDGAAALVAAGVAAWVYRRYVRTGRWRSGASALAFIGTYSAARAVIEVFRYHAIDVGPLATTGWQVVFTVIGVAATFGLISSRRRETAPAT